MPDTVPTPTPLATLPQKQILIIEDDVFLAKAYQLEFSRMGVEVLIISDGTQALAQLQKEPPAVVLLDLLLPGVGGIDILKAIRKSESWQKVPVIVLSNLDEQQFVEEAKTLGVDDYMVKANTQIHNVVEKAKQYISP